MATDAIDQAKKDAGLFATNQDFRILLIDDNPDANESMESLLTLLGYDVRTAQDAIAGLDIAIAFEPHLILSDIGMPGMDGYQLAPILRKAAGARKVVIAAATGYGLPEDRLRSRAAGFDYHLVKPLEADFLLNFIAHQVASY
jgi:CheY-like chemotaxis protein